MRAFLCLALNLYVLVLVVRMVMSWFPMQPGSTIERINILLRRITDPVLLPLRRVIPPLGGIDLSPLFALLFLQIVVGRMILRC